MAAKGAELAENETLRKLRMKSGQRAIVTGSPEGCRPVLADIPKDVTLVEALEGEFDFIQIFVKDRIEIEQKVDALRSAVRPGGLLWICYPKGKAIRTDLNRDILREALEAHGLKAVSLIAIDDVWSAMRFKPV